jgi:hypothetical protein
MLRRLHRERTARVDKTQTALTQQPLEVSQMATRLARHHAQNSRVGKPRQGLSYCARCGEPVPHDSDHLRAQLQGSAVVLHWRCFLALMRGGGNTPDQYNREGLKAVSYACGEAHEPRMGDRSTANDEILAFAKSLDN